MQTWKFLAVPSRASAGFAWRWRQEADDRTRESERTFELYYDCLEDARANGYAGDNPRPQESGAVGESKDVKIK